MTEIGGIHTIPTSQPAGFHHATGTQKKSSSVEPYTLLAMLTTEGNLHGFPRGLSLAALKTGQTCREKREKMEMEKMEKMEMSKVQLLSSKLMSSEVSSDALRSSMLFWGKLVDSCVFIW